MLFLSSLPLLGVGLTIYIIANLAVGYTFSTIAQNQLQAMQMTVFFLLPATHFLRIARGVLLKANTFGEIAGELWPLLLFTLVMGTVALARFRRTLD